MGFGYDADIVNFWSQAGMNKIGQHAESLVATLADERTDSEDVRTSCSKPNHLYRSFPFVD